MHTEAELKANKEIIARKRADVLDGDKGSDLEYIQSLQTLAKLEDAVDQKLNVIIGAPA